MRPSILYSIQHSVPQMSYTVGRPFQWPWFSVFVYGFMFVVLAILIPANVALQGYQVITTYKQDPNTTSPLWFHKFIGYPEPGSACDDYILHVGDSFKTNVGLFSYTLANVSAASKDDQSSFGNQAVPYKGYSLDWRDVDQVGLVISSPQTGPSGSMSIRCFKNGFQITAYTSTPFVQSALQFTEYGIPETDSRDPIQYLVPALLDVFNAFNISDDMAPMQLGLSNVRPYCPVVAVQGQTLANLTGDASSDEGKCPPEAYTSPPFLEIIDELILGDQVLNASIQNYLQLLTALVRFDLGNAGENNFISNTEAVMTMNNTFQAAPSPEPIYENGKEVDLGGQLIESIQVALEIGDLPLQPSHYYSNTSKTPVIVATYECHLTVWKSPGSAAISVIVATLSISSTIWASLMMTAAFLAKRNKPEANYCQYHSLEDAGTHPDPASRSEDMEMGDMSTALNSASDIVTKIPWEDDGEDSRVLSFDHHV